MYAIHLIFHYFVTCLFRSLVKMATSYFLFFYFSFAMCITNVLGRIILQSGQNDTNIYNSKARCEIPKTAPRNIENAIVECQVEIQIALLSDAIELVGGTKSESQDLQSASNEGNRKTRSADTYFTEDERKIAGCLLQCVYRKMKAVNEYGFPKADGLVTLYTEGVTDPEYVKGTSQAVNSCLVNAKKKYSTNLESLQDNGATCDVAFYTFDCISDLIDDYCKQEP